MFRTGRRNTTVLRATAGLGVTLMLAGLYRPAFATIDVAKGAATAPGKAPPASAPAATATAAAAPSERVRGAIVPVGVKLENGAMGVDPWALFDGDGTTVFQTGQPLRVRVSLPRGVALETIGVYGGKGGVVGASAGDASGAKVIAGLERVALDALAPRWNRFSAKAPVETATLLLDITPAPGQRAEVPELELWGRAAPSLHPSSSRAWAEALLTHLPPGAVQIAATPAAATIAAPQLGPAGHVPLTFDLDRAPRMFERAFLVYELEGLAHWSAVVRRVNWQAPQGGFHAVGVAHKGLQVEEISPDWLRQGRNELQFLVSDRTDLAGYKVKNLRVVGVPAAGNPDARPQIDTPRADKIAAALVDGSRETGLTNKDIRKPQTVDFRFTDPSQLDSLLVAVDKGAKGTLSAQAIVRGAVDPKSQVGAELDQLGTGWARLPLDSLPAEADGIRVTLRGARGESSGGLVSELRVTGSRLPTRRVSSLTVTHPLHGECVDGEAYVRGFLRGDASGSTKGATLRIAGADRPEALKWDGSFSAVMQPPGAALRSGGKWQVELEARFANGDRTGAAIDIEGCKEPVVASKKTGPREDEGAPFGQVVRAGQSAKLAFAGATLEIPAGALDDDTRITIRPISDVEIPATDETLTNVTAGGRAYRLGPHGLKFAKAVNLTIPFDRSRFVGGQAEDDLGAYYFDDQAKRWVQVQTLRGDAFRQALTAATTHFTDFMAGTISSPDHPTADSFNPNSIKDMKAADPATGIDLIQPPEPSPDGAAHTRFPLWVPPGRQGMQPSLAVSYSSDAGNGLMGIGWSLPVSTIDVDTRFGVPRYDQAQESETYSVDGELLVMDPGQPARGPKTFFHRMAEGKFDTIIRHMTVDGGPVEKPTTTAQLAVAYRWEVIDKRGTHFFYGETFSARASVELRGVFRWYLSRVVDAFGNQIIYTYDKTFPLLHSAPDAPSVSVLLKIINYTADSSGGNAHYRVEFAYDGQPPNSGADTALKLKRPDVFTNARGGILEVTAVRLARVQVYEAGQSGPNNIRRYEFPYVFGAFGKSLLQKIIVAQGPPNDVDTAPKNFYEHTFNYIPLIQNAFDAPVAWTGVTAGSGLSNAESASLNGTAMGGWGPGGCKLFHGVFGASSSLSLPISLPADIPDRNEDVARRGLIDVNGDGLPDLVGDTGVLLNRGDTSYSATPRTFTAGPATLNPLGSINHSKRTSTGLNVGVHLLFEAAHAGLGYAWGSNGDDQTMADIDGDGFVDYLTSSGTFKLNTHQQGFGASGVGWGQLPSTKLMSQEAIDLQKNRFLLTEPTVRWVAPFSGNVEIGASALKAPNVSPTSDGVRLFFEQYRPTRDPQGHITGSTKISSWSEVVSGTTICGIPEAPATSGCGNNASRRHLSVRQDDRLYFRVNARDDIEDDAVTWNPTINYQAITDFFGNNPVSVAGAQLAFPEPSGGASAFSFQQAADLRLAGKPIPTWRNASSGSRTVNVRITTTGAIKHATSDEVSFEVMLAPNGNFATAHPLLAIPGFQSTYPASHDGPITDLNFSQPVQPDDRIFFRVSSPSPIDPKQIDWRPNVEYFDYCRHESLPPQQADFSAETTFCGEVRNCSSSAGGGFCRLLGDPNPDAKIALSTIRQDIPAYFRLLPWHQIGVPVGFLPSVDGTATVTGSYRSALPARLVARGQHRLADAKSVVASPVNFISSPVMTFPVTAGKAILFDTFVSGVNAPDPNVVGDGTAWNLNVSFNGTTTPLVARRNYVRIPAQQENEGDGQFHSWTQFEWNVTDPSAPNSGFSDFTVQGYLAQGFGGTINQSTVDTVLPVLLMRQAPAGIQQPALTVPGPLWAGSSTDGYIGEAKFKPSRTGRPVTGSSVMFSNTNTTNTDFGYPGLLNSAIDFSKAETNFQLVDVNGDHYPDLVSNTGVRLNRPQFATASDSTIDRTMATGGTFDSTEIPFKSGTDINAPLPNLSLVDGRQVTSSIGISSMVATSIRATKGAKANIPTWVSFLPTLGIAYGNSQTTEELVDINGDGLPDSVRRAENGDLIVRLNLGYNTAGTGYRFTGNITYSAATWTQMAIPPPSFSGSILAAIPGNFSTAINDGLAAQNPLTGFDTLRLDALRFQNTAGNNVGGGYAYFGGNLTASVSRTLTDLIDINGDGLPDMVKRLPNNPFMIVKFNLGDDFGPEVAWSMPAWQAPSCGTLEQIETAGFGPNDALAFAETKGGSLSAGYSQYFETVFAGCWGGEVGVGGGLSTIGSEMRFQDMDGDGAPDHVLKVACDGSIFVRKNGAKNHDGAKPNLLQRVDNPLGGGFSLTYRQLGNVVDVQNHVDMPDQRNVLVHINVFSSLAGNPIQDLGLGTFVDYGLTPSTNPLAPTSIPSGFYDRGLREFFGFSRVTVTRNGDGLEIRRKYDTTGYARRHLLLEETTRDSITNGGRLFSRTVRTPTERNVVIPGINTVIPGAKFVPVTTERTYFYEFLVDDPALFVKRTTRTYDFDATGNMTVVDDLGDDDPSAPVSLDDVHYGIGYQFIFETASQTLLPRANNIVARDAGQNILRHRFASYGSRGEMLSQGEALFGGKEPITGQTYVIGQSPDPTSIFTYDEFGNIKTATAPDGYKFTYTYDSTQTHVATITDSFNLQSTRGYDLRFGKLSDTKDVNGQRMHVRFDLFGRSDQFCGPGDVVNGSVPNTFACSALPTIAYSYAIAQPSTSGTGNVGVPPYYALTKHRDVGRVPATNDTLDTVVFVDGYGRVRQTKKDGFSGGQVGRFLSGRVTFDAVGRVYQKGFQTFESAGQQTVFTPFPNVPFAKTNAYDVIGRLRAIQSPDDRGTTIAPDGAKVVTTFISFDPKVLDGRLQLAKTVRDPQDKLRTQYLSPREEILAVSEVNRIGTAFPNGPATVLTTRYTRDPLSQLTQVQDHSGNLTTAKYDSVGHMVELLSPDAGKTEWRYDGPGRLAAKETANLRVRGQFVRYTYDRNRLKTIAYPAVPGATLPVTYTYGDPGAPFNQAGRISRIEDESGIETRNYDVLGNVGRMEKTPRTMSSSIPGVTYKMDYTFDLFGRVLNMTYPDGEVVKYEYDAGGLVNKVTGTRNAVTTAYVSSLLYNEREQRVDLALGNGWNSHYVYQVDTKRLGSVVSTRATAKIQDIAYGYDLVGNITSITNSLPTLPPVAPNTVIAPGPTFQSFVYDDLYQLANASGTYTGCACGCSNSRNYVLKTQYDGLGNILRKDQSDAIVTASGQVTPQVATTYNNVYTYGSTRPHAPTSVGGTSSTTISYDADGNQTQYSGNFGPSRSLTWTEDDRLRSETDSGFTSAFLYDAGGNRSHKRRTTLETWYVNANYVVKNSLTESKHIMLGERRIVTAVATITNRANPTTAGANTLFYYHPDHVQSTSYVTGADGSILQHDEYFPSGEVWFQEQKNNDARNTQPYLFNAKELDETGLYYFGSRYYNPKLSVWTSADPILAGYMRGGATGGVFNTANLSVYSYAWNNPIGVRDPDGSQSFPVNWDPRGQAGAFLDQAVIGIQDQVRGNQRSFGLALGGDVESKEATDYPVGSALGSLGAWFLLIFSAGKEGEGGGGGGGVGRSGGAKAGPAVGAETAVIGESAPAGAARAQPSAAAAALERANAEQAAGRTHGTAAGLQVGDQVFTDVSTGGARSLHPEVTDILTNTPKELQSDYHTCCAEPGAVSQALKAGVDPRGGTSAAARIRKPGHPAHGTPIDACSSCRFMLDWLGIKYN